MEIYLIGIPAKSGITAMTTGYTFSITEKNSMERLFGILPVRISQLVIGRYIFVLVLGAVALVVSLLPIH